MSTNKKNTGVRNHNTNRAPAAAGSGVTVNPSAAVPPSATTPAASPAPAELTAGQWLYIESEIKAFREGFVPLLARLHTALGEIPSEGTARASVSAQHKEAASQYAGLLRQYPEITSTVSPDVIDAGLAVNAALALVKSDFQQALPGVMSSEQRAGQFAWTDARMVRSAAKVTPHKDTILTAKIASIEALLHRGKLVSTTASTAAKAQTSAERAQQKAARAAAKAAKTAQTAARTAQVHAENHPQTPDVVIVPAGTTPKG